MKNPFWTTSIPIWNSRPDRATGGKVSSFEVPGWLFMLISTLILINVLLWASIGIVVAVLTIIGAVV
jgi:hypothetical protein